MMVSQIQSNFRGMGSGLVADGLGFMFQDRGELFSSRMDTPTSTHPASAPSRPSSPASPPATAHLARLRRHGGDMQPQGQTQIIVNRVDYGLDVQSAADSPRWHHEGSSQSMGEDPPNLDPKEFSASKPVSPPPLARLSSISAGHGRERRRLRPLRVHRAPQPKRRPLRRPRLRAGSEMRADGCALAY